MYRLFCNNLRNYLDKYIYVGTANDPRLKITEPINVIADPDLYRKFKSLAPPLYTEANNLIYEIGNNIDRFPAFKAFSWELWGYGFDKAKSENCSSDKVEEQLKLVDLLLSCHYWIES